MPRKKLSIPVPSREKGQISIDLPAYLTRYIPQWGQPAWLSGNLWRQVVQVQPIAVICRETLISMLGNLDWRIEAKDSNKRDELKEEINYYQDFFTNNEDWDYYELIEFTGKDLLDIPFGSAIEVGRENDDPEGKILWIEPLDGATLWPTLNKDYPIGQRVPESAQPDVFFPQHRVNRIYISPRTEIKYKGWGMPPPEKIYLTLEALSRGDRYYANLLLDTPPAGLLDLLDMSEDSATKWLASWKELLSGVDPFKIPVLYEHTSAAQFVSFTKSPTELMFDKAIMKYATLCTAGYGITVGDIGYSESTNGGDTLAGTIRSERKTRKTGLSRIKKKYTYFFNRMLPSGLEWKYIDLDDEVSVAIARARLANAQAWGIWIDKKAFTPKEARMQHIADGLMTISVPEDVPSDAKWPTDVLPTGAPKRNELVQSPVPASAGGQGEVRQAALEYAMQIDPEFKELIQKTEDVWPDLTEDAKEEISGKLQNMLDGIIEEEKIIA